MLDALLMYLSDFLMFMPETWDRLVARYHQDIWPIQIPTVMAGFGMLWLMFYRRVYSDRLINSGLCVFWLWVGVVFHFKYFTTISWAAWGFGGLFILQAVLHLLFGVVFNKIQFQLPGQHSMINRFGVIVILLSLLVVPLATAINASDWTQSQIAGISPDATSLATIGFMLSAKPGARGVWMLLPILWLLISLAQSWTMTAGG